MGNQGLYDLARRRAQAKYGFSQHLLIYVAVIVLLIVINLVTHSGDVWFIWPMIGWGFAVALHAATTFCLPGTSTMLDRMAEKEIEKEKTKLQ